MPLVCWFLPPGAFRSAYDFITAETPLSFFMCLPSQIVPKLGTSWLPMSSFRCLVIPDCEVLVGRKKGSLLPPLRYEIFAVNYVKCNNLKYVYVHIEFSSIYISVYMHIYIYICMYVFVYICVCVCLC